MKKVLQNCSPALLSSLQPLCWNASQLGNSTCRELCNNRGLTGRGGDVCAAPAGDTAL